MSAQKISVVITSEGNDKSELILNDYQTKADAMFSIVRFAYININEVEE